MSVHKSVLAEVLGEIESAQLSCSLGGWYTAEDRERLLSALSEAKGLLEEDADAECHVCQYCDDRRRRIRAALGRG